MRAVWHVSAHSLLTHPVDARPSAVRSADYFAARREVETAYLKALARIAKRPFLSDPSTLGGFAPVYERLALELGELASVHGELEGRLEEAEAVLRTASTRGEWSRVKEVRWS